MAALKSWTLRGGVAVVTGAASGIGAALAGNLARRGMHLALVDLDPAGLEATAAQARAAGVTVSTHVLDVADHAAVAALPAAVLARESAAQLVNVSSIFGIIAPPGQTAYAASKFAVRGFSESLRHELATTGSPVGVTLVHPGGVRTAISENARLAKGLDAGQVARERANWRSLLALDPASAAEQIARAIERRAPRVLVGKDARAAALVQRLFPVSYWKHVARDIARRVGHQPT